MLTSMIRAFKEKLRREPVIGPFSKTEDPAFIETLGHAGFDFVILDTEHGPNSTRSLQHLVRAAQIGGALPIVRLKENAPFTVGEALDIGAGGVQAPQINGAAEAHELIQRARFAPAGRRGVCRYVRAADYSALPREDYFREANEAVLVVQIEGEAGLANLNEIIAVPGIDIVFVGPYDLSQALGLTGQVDHPRVKEKVRQIAATCRAAGLAVGTFVESPATAREWAGLGVHYLCYSVDVGIFLQAGREIVKAVRAG